MHQCPVLAIRVVQPGLLGSPRDLLLPLAGHLDGINRVWPVLSRFAPQTNYIRLFRAIQVHPLRHPYLTPSRELRLRELGEQHLTEISAELRRRLPVAPFRLEHRVSISTDWVNDALVQASRLKVEMILLGISERNLAHRVLYGDEIEMILRDTPCDVGVYRGP